MEKKKLAKQLIILRKDLKHLKKGKAVAQGAHASLANLLKKNKDKTNKKIDIDLTEEEQAWLSGYFTKVCLKCNSEEELFELKKRAESHGLTVSLIKDAGFTCFNEPTYTAIAIGPHWEHILDNLFSDLKLF